MPNPARRAASLSSMYFDLASVRSASDSGRLNVGKAKVRRALEDRQMFGLFCDHWNHLNSG